MSATKPLITANMVTTARLLAMPVLGWLIYVGPEVWWWALVLGTVIGSTDFVDGYLARKHGPTVLGGLLDPIADKMLIAAWYLPLVDMGFLPAWPVAILFLREFLVTALRSAFAQRDMQMKTSYLAKVKTWAQMQGLGVIVLIILLQDRRDIMLWLLGVGALLPLPVAIGFYFVKKRVYWGALIMAALQGAVLGAYLAFDTDIMVLVLVIAIVALTWISGADYLIGGFPRLRRAGDFAKADLARILGGIALPLAVTLCMIEAGDRYISIACILILAIELAIGGLDNLLSHHRANTGAAAWAGRALGAPLLLAAATLATWYGPVPLALPLAAAALAVTVVGATAEFWRGRAYYLDEKLRDEKTQETAAPAV